MAVTSYWYGKAFLAAFNKEIDWNETNKIKVALVTSGYTPDQDAHDYFDDITNEVAAGNGYTAGGKVLGTPSLSYTGGTNVFAIDGDDSVWTSSTITARYAVVYYDTGTPATSPLIGYLDFGENVSSVNGDFTIQWHTDGIFKVTIS